MLEHSDTLIAKYAAPPIYAPLHSEKAILLKTVSPCQERGAITATSAENHTYGLLPTTLVLSGINEAYTTLNNSTQKKQAISQAMDLNDI